MKVGNQVSRINPSSLKVVSINLSLIVRLANLSINFSEVKKRHFIFGQHILLLKENEDNSESNFDSFILQPYQRYMVCKRLLVFFTCTNNHHPLILVRSIIFMIPGVSTLSMSYTLLDIEKKTWNHIVSSFVFFC